MWKITKGYKEGRAVMYYDLTDSVDNKVRAKVHKDEVVKLSENGEIHNTKIQWWEGKAIVRCSDVFEIVKADSNTVVKAQRRNTTSKNKEQAEQVVVKSVVVGKLNPKKKDSIAYGGYDKKLENQQLIAQSNINHSNMETIKDLFIDIAKAYRLINVNEYLNQFSKKVNIDRKISSIAKNNLLGIQDSINTYLMNMAYKEIQETWLKYSVKAV